MSKFRNLIFEAFILAESTAKIEYILNNKKLVDKLQQSIGMDVEIDDKTMTPADLLTKWDQDPILSKNLNWVAKQYGDMQFYYGDTYKVKEALEKFDKYKNKKALINNQTLRSNDLNKYSYKILVQDLDQIDDSDVTNLGTSARKKAVEKGKDEAEIVYEDNDWIVIVPKTQAAAMYWGKDTKWCTAADSENNMFNFYNRKGPLYITINKHDPNEKYQLCFAAAEYKDKQDFDNLPPIKKDSPLFEFFKDKANKSDYGNWFKWFSRDEISEEDMLEALRKSKGSYRESYAFSYIEAMYNYKGIPEEFVQKAIKVNPAIISYIKDPIEADQIAAVSEDGQLIRRLNNPSEKVQIAAVTNSPKVIKVIRQDLKIKPSENVQLACVQADGSMLYDIYELGMVPSLKVIGAAIKNHPSSIKDAHEFTDDMALYAVQKEPYLLEYLFKYGQIYGEDYTPSKAIQKAAVEKDPRLVHALHGKLDSDIYELGWELLRKQKA